MCGVRAPLPGLLLPPALLLQVTSELMSQAESQRMKRDQQQRNNNKAGELQAQVGGGGGCGGGGMVCVCVCGRRRCGVAAGVAVAGSKMGRGGW